MYNNRERNTGLGGYNNNLEHADRRSQWINRPKGKRQAKQAINKTRRKVLKVRLRREEY